MKLPRTFVVLLLAFGAATAFAAGNQSPKSVQQPTRDAPKVAGTAEIAGVIVTADQSPQPVRHAKVSVSSVDGQGDHVTYSDDAGRFSVTGLAAGRYAVSAAKLTLVRAAYGARRYDRPGTPVTVSTGEHVTTITLKMQRGGVITGTVTDQNGQPAPGVTVHLNQYRTVSGDRSLIPASFAGGNSVDTTDDRGVYRIFGVPPGDYVVNATPRNSGAGDIRQMTASELAAAQQAAQQPGASTPIADAGDAITVGFAPVFYPGTTSSADAVTITMTAGEERSGVDIPMQLVRTARIEGVVVTPNGVPPQSVQLLMVPSGNSMPMQISLSRVVPDAQGKFTYTGVTPGQYTITARASLRSGGSGAGAANVSFGPGGFAGGDNAMTLWAMADVSADGQPITGVTLTLQPGMTVTGTIHVDAKGADAPNDLSRARISLAPAGNGGGLKLGVPNAQVDASGTFTLSGVTPGTYRIAASFSSPEANWTAKSAVSHGRDALDFPLEVLPNQDVSDLVVTFTNETQEVSGRLQDASGRPAPDFTIVVFPSDKAYWPVPRRIKTTRPGTDGTFVVTGLPPGDYRIAAVTDMAPGDQNDATFLDQLVGASFAFALHEGEKRVQDLKIGSRPD